jgi:hypothetical protein
MVVNAGEQLFPGIAEAMTGRFMNVVVRHQFERA